MLVWVPFSIVVPLAHEEHTEDQTFPVAGITTLEVDSGAGDITIVGTDTDEIVVTARISEGLRSTGHSRRVEGSTLRLSSTCPNWGSDWCRVDYDVTVPASLAVVVDSEHGRVEVAGMTSDVRVDNRDGSTALTDIDGAVRIRSRDGRVTATGLTSPTVDVNGRDGSVTVELAVPPDAVTASVQDGSLTIVVPADGTAYRVDATSRDGSNNVSVPTDPASSRSITASTRDGSLTVRPAG
jgi:hypothetical protein